MTCKNCGAEIGEYSAFCTYCGKPVGNPAVNLSKNDQTQSGGTGGTLPPGYSEPMPQDGREPFQQPELGQVPDYNRSATSWQNPHSGYIPNAPQAIMSQTNGASWNEIKLSNCIIGSDGTRYGIGWLKFIVYFQLFAAAFLTFLNAISFFTGAPYGEDAELVYAFFEGLKAVDVIYGILLVIVAGLLIFTRFMLVRLKRFAPWLYLGLYTSNLVTQLIYLGIVSGITKLSILDLIDSSSVTSFITSAVMIGVNFTYFKHRSAAFVN